MPPAPTTGQEPLVVMEGIGLAMLLDRPMMNAPVLLLQGRYAPPMRQPANGPVVATERTSPGVVKPGPPQLAVRATTVVVPPVMTQGFSSTPLTVQVPS